MSADRADLSATPPEPLTDGIYRNPEVGRWSRLALVVLAGVAVFSAAAVSSSVVAIVTLAAIAGGLLGLRSLLGRPRLVVTAQGLTIVGYLRATRLEWQEIASAGGAPAPPPLRRVERVLAVRTVTGRQLTVASLRDAVDPRTGGAPRIAELAASLVARVEWSLTSGAPAAHESH